MGDVVIPASVRDDYNAMSEGFTAHPMDSTTESLQQYNARNMQHAVNENGQKSDAILE